MSCGTDPVNYPINPYMYPPGLPHCHLSFSPTKLPQDSFYAAVLHRQVPNSHSGLLGKATTFQSPGSCSQLGYSYLGSARSSQPSASLMPAAAPLARCSSLLTPTIPITHGNAPLDEWSLTALSGPGDEQSPAVPVN